MYLVCNITSNVYCKVAKTKLATRTLPESSSRQALFGKELGGGLINGVLLQRYYFENTVGHLKLEMSCLLGE